MNRSIVFAVDTVPVTWKRAARNGRRTYTDPVMAAAQTELAWAYKTTPGTWPPDTLTRFSVTIDVYTKTRRRADLDNFAKLVLDALEGHAYANDAQVDELTVRRHHRPSHPGWKIAISTPHQDLGHQARTTTNQKANTQ